MRLKIRCDGESEKFCKICWELNKALGLTFSIRYSSVVSHLLFYKIERVIFSYHA